MSIGPLIQNNDATKHISVKQKQSTFNSYLQSQKISPFARNSKFKFDPDEDSKSKIV